MSDEVQMPDPKVEAERLSDGIIHPDTECAVRSLMARTLRAAAVHVDRNWETSAQTLERMASEIEGGKT